MSERKVLNKYYPPDFDPSKIPRMKLAKNRQYTVRLMAPFNMRCATCGEYIYKGKKFNARKEDVENQDYLGIRIYRFYIKCTRCLQEISFKTDPKNTDYEIEAGATRNFMALKLAEEQAKKEEEEQKEEEANNPMKLLEYRTEQSRQEIEVLESLEELKELNRRQQSVDYEGLLKQYQPETKEERIKREQQEDDEFIKNTPSKSSSIVFRSSIVPASSSTTSAKLTCVKYTAQCRQYRRRSVKFNNTTKHKIVTEEIIEDVDDQPIMKQQKLDILPAKQLDIKKNESWNKSIGVISKKPLSNLVKTRQTDNFKDQLSKSDSKVKSEVQSVPTASGLSLLASYSGSGSDSDSQ